MTLIEIESITLNKPVNRGPNSRSECQQPDRRGSHPRPLLEVRLAWEAVSGRGRIHIFTVAHRAPNPKFAGQLPLVVAIVELEEGPHLVTNLVDCDPEKVEVGEALEVRLEAIDDSDGFTNST